MAICDELEELIPAYMLDAVDEGDRTRIEAHLPRCQRCSQLVKSYQPVSDLLAYAAEPTEPPADLKYRVLAATAPAQVAPARQAAPAPAPVEALSTWLASLFRAPAFSAVALLLLVAFGIWNLALQNQMQQQVAATNQLAADLNRERAFAIALAYSDGQPKRLEGTQVAAQAMGRLYSVYDGTALVVVTYDLPVLKSDQAYQLWLIDRSGNRISGGVFTVDDRGRGWLYVRPPKPLSEYDSVGVTVEPSGGSPGPTGAKMLGGSL